ncbi:MAG: S-layer homology domain-containing protein [Syntrophomonas sp.]|nr:S-layer homology domain-containing protein [Syntrophomonas sp.]
MLKKLLVLTITLSLLLSGSIFALAETTLPTSIDKPQNLSIRSNGDSEFRIRWTNPASVLKINEDIISQGHSLYYAIDWKKNDGNWNIGDITHDSPNYIDEIHGYFFGFLDNIQQDENGASESFLVTWHLDPTVIDTSSTFDLANNTYYFRMRYVLEPYEEELEDIISPYSETVVIGKSVADNKLTKLDAPMNLKLEVKKDSNSKPYFQLNWTIPDSILTVNKQLPVYHIIDFKVGDGKWLSETTKWDGMPKAPSGLLTSNDKFDAVEEGLADNIVIEENIYHFRVAYVCEQQSGDPVISAYSNIATTKMEAYSNASEWAKSELDDANIKGLIPDSLIGADMTKPITREEFAELVVKLYEVTEGTKAQAASPNPFSDTTNPQILKGFKLGVTMGTSATTFAPKELTNREQVAAMLSRAIRLMAPGEDFSTAGAPIFTDQKDISSWALEHVKYMSKLGIIKGAEGKFMPKATTTVEIAQNYATTTREQAVAMSVRTFNIFDK